MTVESVVWDEWYPVAIAEDVTPCKVYKTRLLGHSIEYACDAAGRLTAWRDNAERTPCRALTRYHAHWVSLGEPSDGFFALPEFDEPDRRALGAGSMAVHVSGLRAIENFLDMAHFPYVHDGYLGSEPYTDVLPYDVSIEPPGEIFARNCRFFQPKGAPTAAEEGHDAQYVYRVARPFVALLYKSSPGHQERMDVIGLFVQPLTEEWCKAHTLLLYLDETTPDSGLRLFQQTIFGQDLMLLSNEIPKKMPLDSRFEIPVRADAMSMAYRRWLDQRGVRYGTYRELESPAMPAPAGHLPTGEIA
ncbi:MAG: aromatic ring-hydroxylating dioxygenase subunit alpha [Proteobacteria bacterium]|nr:aromatic ring-hydroxylating dioxygenase subunit alpha [Pseudomonadota bacterium]